MTHTFTIDELNIDVTLSPGESKVLTVTPSSPGDFSYYCRFHKASNGMQGTLTVSRSAGGGASHTATNSSPARRRAARVAVAATGISVP